MNYTIITKNIQILRCLQSIILKKEKDAEIFLECDILRAVDNRKRIRDTDILLVEIGNGMDAELEYLVNTKWEEKKPEIIWLLSSWNEVLFRKIEKISSVSFLNVPFDVSLAEMLIGGIVDNRRQYLHYKNLRNQSRYLESHKAVIQQQFWSRLMAGQISLEPSCFLEEAANCGVEINLEDVFHVAIFSRKLMKERNNTVEKESRRILLEKGNYWFSNCEGDYILVEQLRPVLIAKNVPNEEFVYQCENFIKQLEKETNIPLCIYYDSNVYCENLLSRVHYVMMALKEDWVDAPGVYPAILLRSGYESKLSVILPEQVETFLQNGYYLMAVQTLERFLNEHAANGEVSSSYLKALRFDMEQVVMCVLKAKGIPAHQVFEDEKFKDLVDNAHISINSFMRWFRTILDYFPQKNTDVTQVEEIQSYVKKHIYENITREEIAVHLYVNADYMSRQYKHNTGETLGYYITREKMKKAGEMLVTSKETIGEIGMALGFSNFAHFSKLFKRFMGCTPKEYRLQNIETK